MDRRTFLFGLPLLTARRSMAAPQAAPVTGLAFSPDGKLLVSSGYRELLVRSVTDLAVVRRIPCDLAQIHGLAFHPTGKLLGIAGGTPGTAGSAQLLSWPDGKGVAGTGAFSDLATDLAFSPDGKMLAVSSADRVARAWEVEKLLGSAKADPLLTLSGHAGPVLAVTYTADGSWLVTGSADRSLRVWDAATGALQRTLTNHTGIVHCLAASPLPQAAPNPHPYCASGSDDRTARVWQPGIGRMVRIVRGPTAPVLAVLYSRDGERLFTAGADGTVRVIDAESDQVIRTWKPGREWIYRLALSPDGKRLVAGDWSGRLHLWDWQQS